MVTRVVGLDIGRDVVRAVEVENPEKSKPLAVRFAEASLPPDSVRSGEVREVNTVATALRKLWATGGFKTRNVVIGIGNQRVLARDLTVPKMSLVQIRESLPFQVQEMLPVPVSEALLDYYPVSEGTGEQGPVVNGLLIAAIKEAVMGNVNAVRAAGLTPLNVDLLPFALSRALARGQFSRGMLAFIDIGASTTNVVITSGAVPQFVRMIPGGGEDITRALVNALEIHPQEAERFKRTLGLGGDGAYTEADIRALEVIRASANELLTSLRNTLNYYTNTHQGESLQGIVLSGGGARLGGIAQALGSFVRVPAMLADPFSGVDMAKGLRDRSREELFAATVPLGLAIGGVA